MYWIMTEELVFSEIRIDEAADRGDSDSRMTSFEIITPLKLQLTMKALLYEVLNFTAGNSWKGMTCLDRDLNNFFSV